MTGLASIAVGLARLEKQHSIGTIAFADERHNHVPARLDGLPVWWLIFSRCRTPEQIRHQAGWRALQSCVMLRLALECCKTTENIALAIKVALTAFEAVVGDFRCDIAGQRRAWKKVAVQEEFRNQSVAIEAIGAMVTFDDQTIAKLRQETGPSKGVDRKIRPRSPKKANASMTISSMDGVWLSASI